MNHNYRLTLAFDGTSYQGWQRQNSTDQTIQGTLERTCAAILREPVRLIGSGRTDAGVHAEAMTAHFFTKKPILDGAAFRQLMNGTLPEDIRLLAIRPVAADFHSRYSAVGKIYRYQIDTGEKMDVFRRKYACHYTAPLDLAAMERAAGIWRAPTIFLPLPSTGRLANPKCARSGPSAWSSRAICC